MQTGYMTNEEIALKLEDANTIMKYKSMIDTAQLKTNLSCRSKTNEGVFRHKDAF